MSARTDVTAQQGDFGPVESLIPHRRPFLMIDSVEEAGPGEYAISRYAVDPALPLLAGHFPGQPVFPGVLLVESMAQTACWVMASGQREAAEAAEAEGAEGADGAAEAAANADAESGAVEVGAQALAADALQTEYRLVRIVQCTFSAPVMPGDSVRTEARLTRSVPPFAQFQCSSFVGARKVAEAQLLVASKVVPAQHGRAVIDTPASLLP